jgi:hypothetical protein
MTVKRWEDDAVVWKGPFYDDQALRYDASVQSAAVSGRIITCVEVVDWDGDGGRDLILSSWDPCYDGQVYLRQQIGTAKDGTPVLGPETLVDGVRGYVTALPDGDRFHLVSASRMRPNIYLYPNIGTAGKPAFGPPLVLELDADWQRTSEYFHMARFVDIDGCGVPELVVGTDSWDDYWPNGLEWNDHGYRAYDAAGRWLGGPLRGYLYAFKNTGTLAAPVFGKGRIVMADENPVEMYGQLAPAFGDLHGTGRMDLIAGEFLNILMIGKADGSGDFAPLDVVCDGKGTILELDHCIHLPCVTDWDGDGKLDILVGAEDGYVTFLRNIGETDTPRFEKVGRVETTAPIIHASVLPSPAAHDFSGDGRPDLIVGNCSGELLFYPTMGPTDAPTLGRETKLTAAGREILVSAGMPGSIQGPSEIMFGYTCPTVADWDGNGLPDVLMSDVLGQHMFYRNEGGACPPRFSAPEPLCYEGRPLQTVWRVRPAVTDWLGGDTLHYVALDEEGRLSDFRRASDTELIDKRFLTWANGIPVTFTEDVGGGRGRVKLCLCDWTGTGRIDLIVGTHARASMPPGPTGAPRNTTHQAGIFYLRNIGTNAEPVFGHPVAMRHRGEVIQMGMHVASPDAVDWTGTGLGLIVGVEDGSIVWLDRADLDWGQHGE